MTEQELKDSMVSCYDNGDAMMELSDEYYLDLILTDLGKLKWLSNDEGWNSAVDTIRKELPGILGYVTSSEDCSDREEFTVTTSPSGELFFKAKNLDRNTKYRLDIFKTQASRMGLSSSNGTLSEVK